MGRERERGDERARDKGGKRRKRGWVLNQLLIRILSI